MVSGQGHAALGFSTAGTPFRADAATVGRLKGDTLSTTQTVSRYTASATAYNPPGDPGPPGPRRWGDYSFTSLDPKDDMTMWTIQEFCDATNSYGVRVVKLIAPPPATPSSASSLPVTIPPGTSVFAVTGTSSSGSGYFDPGANPPAGPAFNHIQASLSPSVAGLTVNSVTYLTPTSLTVSITNSGAPAGNHDLTITNPDGQSATTANFFTVAGPATPDLTVTKSHVGNFFRGETGATVRDHGDELRNPLHVGACDPDRHPPRGVDAGLDLGRRLGLHAALGAVHAVRRTRRREQLSRPDPDRERGDSLRRA